MNKCLCYNCGKILGIEDVTVEHIPAKNLYEGYSEEYKQNRITVPACLECNNFYSKIDQEIRDVLAVINDDINQKTSLTQKGIRSIMRKSNWKDRTFIDEKGNVVAVNFSYQDLKQIHIKNFKGLFLKKYGFPLPNDFKIDIITVGDEDKLQSVEEMSHYLRINKSFECSGHPDVFKFIISDITPDEITNALYESRDFDKLIAIIGLFIYHNSLEVFIMAMKEKYIDKAKS